MRQFGSGDLLDGDTDGDGDSLDQPLPGGTDPRSIQLKEIEVAVTSTREAGLLGRRGGDHGPRAQGVLSER